MSDLFRLIWYGLIGLFRSRAALEAEILLLRHQLNILRRATPKRVALGSIDRLVFVGLYHLAPGVLWALKISCYDRPVSPQRDKDVSSNAVAALPSSEASHSFSS
jgi:hypothetical protein